MENNLRKPAVILKKGEIPVQVMDDVIGGDMLETKEIRLSESDYGILNDYYEIFGEMEEYVM